MKKLLLITLILIAATGLVILAQDAGTNQPPALPTVDVQSITNVVHVVQPIPLTAAQLDGIIQAMEVLTPPVGRKFAESVRQIQAFQHVRASGGKEAMPAGWEPGKPTLKPGPDLVGKVWEVWKPEME